MAESRELKSALLTKEVHPVDADIEIDFRMVDSLLALVPAFMQRRSIPCQIS